MNGFLELPSLTLHGVRAFIGGCYLRGIGSKFHAKAHAHPYERIICFRSSKWLDRPELMIHELAHILTEAGHTDKWRAKVIALGGTVAEVPGLLRSYEKKTRKKTKRFVKSPNKFLADLGFVREVKS